MQTVFYFFKQCLKVQLTNTSRRPQYTEKNIVLNILSFYVLHFMFYKVFAVPDKIDLEIITTLDSAPPKILKNYFRLDVNYRAIFCKGHY